MNDIVLLLLTTKITFNKYVKPVCLPTKKVRTGTKCYMTGWGPEKSGEKMSVLLKEVRNLNLRPSL